jgi:hypothetical protein
MKGGRVALIGGGRRTRRLVCAVALFGGAFAVATGAAVLPASQAGAEPSVIPIVGTTQLSAIACTSATTCVAVGTRKYVLVHDGTNGGPVSLPTGSLPGLQLNSVACPTSAYCYGVGTGGAVGRTGVTQFVYGEALTPAVVDATTLQSVACTPGTTACVAVGSSQSHGAVVTLTGGNPSAALQQVATLSELSAVACPTPTTCLAAGRTKTGLGGFVTITSGVVGATHLKAGVPALTTIACATVSTCWAGTNTGEIVPVTSTALETPVSVARVSSFQGSTCSTATQCYLTGYMSTEGATTAASVVVPVTAGTVGAAQVDMPGYGRLYGITCVGTETCLAVGSNYFHSVLEGVLVTSAVPTPSPTISSVTLSGSGYGLTVTAKGKHFEPWPPEASPIDPVDCAPGAASYDYATGVLSFVDMTEGWSAGTPGSCIGIVIKSWSTTKVTFGLGPGYVWPRVAYGDAYQVTILGVSKAGTATVASPATPSIKAVLVTGETGPAPPTLTVEGANLGTRVPLHDPSPTCVAGDTSLVFPNGIVDVNDYTNYWTAGEYGDCLGLVVTSWTATKVVLTFGPFYPDAGVGPMEAGDSISVGLLGASWSGTATATPPPTITALKVTGKAASPVVTVTGKGFGSPPSPDPSTPVSCVPGDTSYTYPAGQLQFSDNTKGWTAGETGDCIGVIVKAWTPTKVTFTFGADYPSFPKVTAGDGISIDLKGTTFTGTAGV